MLVLVGGHCLQRCFPLSMACCQCYRTLICDKNQCLPMEAKLDPSSTGKQKKKIAAPHENSITKYLNHRPLPRLIGYHYLTTIRNPKSETVKNALLTQTKLWMMLETTVRSLHVAKPNHPIHMRLVLSTWNIYPFAVHTLKHKSHFDFETDCSQFIAIQSHPLRFNYKSKYVSAI